MKGKTKQKKQRLTLQEIIDIADGAYPDGMVGLWHRNPSGKHGDTLAKFIAAELAETFDSKASREEQIGAAAHAITNVVKELNRVIGALENA